MEEILASIRRIIEDSESGRKASDYGAETPVSPVSDETVAPEKEEAETESFRAELGGGAHQEKAGPAQQADANVLPHPASPPRPPEISRPQSAQTVTAMPPLAAQPHHEENSRHAAPKAEQAPSVRTSIISEKAERQVAAAFEELSEAFAASRRRSFDEMAEEMLRPMLQEWLDNNLPLLVERLVREEIERVARGAAR
jgi:cell pole-organizing protein PopZ